MITTTIKKNTNIVTGVLPKISKGHQPHRSGSGAHKHKNDRRLGNRSQQLKKFIQES